MLKERERERIWWNTNHPHLALKVLQEHRKSLRPKLVKKMKINKNILSLHTHRNYRENQTRKLQ